MLPFAALDHVAVFVCVFVWSRLSMERPVKFTPPLYCPPPYCPVGGPGREVGGTIKGGGVTLTLYLSII